MLEDEVGLEKKARPQHEIKRHHYRLPASVGIDVCPNPTRNGPKECTSQIKRYSLTCQIHIPPRVL